VPSTVRVLRYRGTTRYSLELVEVLLALSLSRVPLVAREYEYVLYAVCTGVRSTYVSPGTCINSGTVWYLYFTGARTCLYNASV
jgi:hypothetical protein